MQVIGLRVEGEMVKVGSMSKGKRILLLTAVMLLAVLIFRPWLGPKEVVVEKRVVVPAENSPATTVEGWPIATLAVSTGTVWALSARSTYSR